VFASMLLMALVAGLWFGLRMPETLHPQHRRRFSLPQLWAGIRITFAQRSAIGHSLAIALFMGCLMSYVSSSQQIFETEIYALGKWFPLAFGGIAAVMGLAFFANSHLVRSFGMHRLSHVCLLLFVACALLLAVVVLWWQGKPPLWLFVLLLSAIQFLMCLTMPNFNAIAMEPLGEVAGTASAVLGVLTTLGGALIGIVVGASFDGSLRPLALTYFACAVLALLAVLWGERGRLQLGRA
jgi:DHA1 family bicyclomycin/chloramphenicol resistance-like MFS transporter